MAGDEGRDNTSDDLFEDLDKFFAPIQDVEWPEAATEGSEEAAAPEAAAPEAPEGPPAAEPPAPDPEPTRRVQPGEGHVTVSGPGVTEPPEDPGVLPEGWSAEIPEIPEASEETFEGDPGSEDYMPAEIAEQIEGQGGLFAGERQDTTGEPPVSVEDLKKPPPEYGDLPGPADPVAAAAAAAASETPRLEDEPSMEAVEAAADQFAQAIRVDPDAPAAPTASSGGMDPADVEQDILADLEDPALAPRTVKVGAGSEGMGGPTWQEPTSAEVGGDPDRRAGDRNLPIAFLVGVGLAALAVVAMALGRGPFAIVAGVALLLAQGELYAAMHKGHHQPATALGLLSGALVLAGAYYKGEAGMLAMVGLSLIFTFLWYMAVPAAHRRNTLTGIAMTMLGVIYVPLFGGYLLVTLTSFSSGRALVLAILGLTFLYDTFAYIAGSFWGDHPLAPSISPSKSWEGTVAILVVVAVSVGAVGAYVDPFKDHVARALIFGALVAVAAQFGDLAESLIKRDLGVKDMSSILPGHGGLLDRIDAVLFVAPIAFLFLRIVL
ncbi:MAG: phosphatidate cytidylyltransferase [Actinomycetota bacterium]|nr:phosphatidate cytidylyltransferase [Actinomycetota bacterium]